MVLLVQNVQFSDVIGTVRLLISEQEHKNKSQKQSFSPSSPFFLQCQNMHNQFIEVMQIKGDMCHFSVYFNLRVAYGVFIVLFIYLFSSANNFVL